MGRLIVNIAGLVTIAAIAIGYVSAEVAPHNAFFLAFATVVVIGGQEFMSRANQQFGRAVRAIVAEPKSYGSPARYGLFVATVVSGLMLTMGMAVAAG